MSSRTAWMSLVRRDIRSPVLCVLEIAERQLLQMGEHPIAQIGLAAAREAMNIDAPAVAKKTLQRGGAENQQRVGQEQRALPLLARCSAVSMPPLISHGKAMPARSVAISERTPSKRKRR